MAGPTLSVPQSRVTQTRRIREDSAPGSVSSSQEFLRRLDEEIEQLLQPRTREQQNRDQPSANVKRQEFRECDVMIRRSPRMPIPSRYAETLHTPEFPPSTASFNHHDHIYGLASPQQFQPNFCSDVPHDSPQTLPRASQSSFGDDTSNLLTKSSDTSCAHVQRRVPTRVFRDDTRFRPLESLRRDGSKRKGKGVRFAMMSDDTDHHGQSLTFGGDLPHMQASTGGVWNDVYCACFGKRIC